MRKIVIAVASLIAGVSLASCASTFDGTTVDTTKNGNVRTVVVQYEGKPLTCVQFNPTLHSESLSCDFVKYHTSNASVPN